ncbi:hypothetical protein HZA33_01300 [Candidatus Pacearchaeota archaeon]|nr:hypothetical protein [Candidatus Pacearchaeota archaeon]
MGLCEMERKLYEILAEPLSENERREWNELRAPQGLRNNYVTNYFMFRKAEHEKREKERRKY